MGATTITDLNSDLGVCERAVVCGVAIGAQVGYRDLPGFGRRFTDIEGGPLTVTAGSICVHGDTAGAVEIARSVKEALTAAGVSVAPFAV